MPGLSKSCILSGLQCQKRLYLQIHHPELIGDDEGRERRLMAGNDVGELARLLHPGGMLIDDENLQTALQRNQSLFVAGHAGPIFEATLARDGVLIRADVLGSGSRGLRRTEVKSSGSVKDYHLSDAAVQAWVVEGEGYQLESVPARSTPWPWCELPGISD